jgi:hypothetical protein
MNADKNNIKQPIMMIDQSKIDCFMAILLIFNEYYLNNGVSGNNSS